MITMANSAGLETHQTARNKVESSTPEEYWRRAVFVPFIDNIIKEFQERFSQLSENSITGLKVILSRVTLFLNVLRRIFHLQGPSHKN